MLLLGIFVAIGGILIIVKQREAAQLQSMLAGGNMPLGCAVAEGIALMVLAAAVFVAYRMGLF